MEQPLIPLVEELIRKPKPLPVMLIMLIMVMNYQIVVQLLYQQFQEVVEQFMAGMKIVIIKEVQPTNKIAFMFFMMI